MIDTSLEQVCICLGLHFNNYVPMHGMNNVKDLLLLHSPRCRKVSTPGGPCHYVMARHLVVDADMEGSCKYRSADKSLARPTSWCILFDGQNNSFDASLVIYINSTNIPPIMIINRI